ncbi:MAG: HNH endonuclease [Alphaproteobacteria bacterium]|nr:HNH endonuclease [Alphaproteobacteria bacterium]
MKARRNPSWSRDELILALDLYMQNLTTPPRKTSREIQELSDCLNRLGIQIAGQYEKFRNSNGVYMKLMNFRRFDPAFQEAGKVGLQRGGKLEETIWNEFSSDPVRLRQVASAIRTVVINGSVPNYSPEEDEDTSEASEGRLLTRLHRSRERSRKLVDQRKSKTFKEKGKLTCEACGFDFETTYGERGKGFIECHHLKPVHELAEGSRTKLEDLALLCSNCHRMVHSQKPWLTVEKLKDLIR